MADSDTSHAPSAWLFLCDRNPGEADTRPLAPMRDDLAQGLLVMELAWPPALARVLFDCQPDAGAGHTLSVFCDPQTGIAVLHRVGGRVRRYALPAPLPAGGPTARLTLGWSLVADRWTLSLAAGEAEARATGRGPILPGRAALSAMCAGIGVRSRDPSVLWFGVTEGAAPPPAAPWIGPQTPIDTPRGPIAAGRLRVGDRVTTDDHGPLPILSIRRIELPGRGTLAPVLLRAPWFACRIDLLVSPDQPVVLSGAAVEYLFDEDEVLVPASALVDGQAALTDNRRGVVAGLSFDLGCGALIAANGCRLATAHHGPAHLAPPPPRLRLDARQAAPLLASGARGAWRSAG